jgi:hypothetical protein
MKCIGPFRSGILIAVTGSLCVSCSPVHYESPTSWGQELDVNGHELRSIDLQRSYIVTGWLPDAGGGHETYIMTNHYLLHRPGMPQKELTFLPPQENEIDGPILPVAGTSAWVMVTDPGLEERVIILVFDANRLLHRREIQVSSKPGWGPGLDYQFESGNSRMRFSYLGKPGTYDVMTDAIGGS